MNRLLLTPAELAVLLETLVGPALALDATALHDLAVTPAQIEAARRALRERGVLVVALPEAEADTSVAAQDARLLATALAPERVFILRSESRGQPARQIIYSRAGDRWVSNTVTPAGKHCFVELGPAAGALEDMLRETGVAALSNQGVPAEIVPLAALLRRASGLHLLAHGALPNAAASPATALSWITAGDGVWLVSSPGPAESAERIPIAQLRVRLLAMLQE